MSGAAPDRMKWSASTRASSVLPLWAWSEQTMAATVDKSQTSPHPSPACGGGIGALRRRFFGEALDQADAVVFAGDLVEPGAHVAAQHQRIGGGLAVAVAVGDEARKRNAGELHLLARHLVELRNGDLDRLAAALEVALVDLRVPVEEARLVDEVLDHEIVAALGIGRDRLDLLERGDRGADHVEQGEIELPAAHEIEEADVGEGLERAREQAGADV